MDDAAHASIPFQGAGAGQALEDAFVLETVLGKCAEPSQLTHAFKAYDAIRRPRSQKVMRTSREAGESTGFGEDGEDFGGENEMVLGGGYYRGMCVGWGGF